ncbi:MAG: 2Fe-2S iron-sulfur cluster binding domain-containing protein [Rhizobiales bacterium]|nr:2Fe-2S iron-sulfur cluster binding domain-containing protein [Hyphomicrobiales bacterium]
MPRCGPAFHINNPIWKRLRLENSAPTIDQFTVEIASTRRQFNIPADHTTLEIFDQNGVFIPSMCRQGICSRCITNVLSGQVDHRDNYLTPEERARDHAILTCCSRAFTSHLTLDL